MRRPHKTALTIEDAVKAATEAARAELVQHGFGEAASITVSAYAETSASSATLTFGSIPPAQTAGGYARAAKLSPGERSKIAQKAANARWGKEKRDGDQSQED